MSHTPPVPSGNQSPYPLTEPTHPKSGELSPGDEAAAKLGGVGEAVGEEFGSIRETAEQQLAAARDAAGPLAEKAKAFARERPWTTAALVGSIGLAVLNTLRGRKA